MKKILSLLLAFSLALSLAACGGSASSAVSSAAVSEAASSAAAYEEEAAAPLSATEPLRIAGLKGPTTMGLVNLLSMEQAGTAAMDYDLQLYGAADEIVPLLMHRSTKRGHRGRVMALFHHCPLWSLCVFLPFP